MVEFTHREVLVIAAYLLAIRKLNGKPFSDEDNAIFDKLVQIEKDTKQVRTED